GRTWLGPNLLAEQFAEARGPEVARTRCPQAQAVEDIIDGRDLPGRGAGGLLLTRQRVGALVAGIADRAVQLEQLAQGPIAEHRYVDFAEAFHDFDLAGEIEAKGERVVVVVRNVAVGDVARFVT